LFALRHWFDALPPPVEGHLDRLVKTVQTLLASPDYAPQRTDGGADPRADATTTRPGASRDSQRRPRKGEGLRRPGLLWAAGAVLAAALIAMVALLALWFASHRNALPPATEIGLLSGDGARLGAEPIMEIGDSFRVEVEPDEAGYLAILQVTSDGDLFEVPVCDDAARGGKRLRIEPRTRYELPRGLPQGYRLTPPAGAELLIVATAADAAGLDAAMDRLKAETRRVAFPIGVPADILAKAATRGKIEIGADDEAQAKIRAVRRLSEELLGKDRVLIIWNLPPPKKDRLPGLE
jgi:hypothetical protein